MGNIAKAYQDKIVIPTYELLQDDLNPIFDKRLDPYPYTMQSGICPSKKDCEYDVVVIENEYLKITVIPSLGGRLFSALDKRNNQPFVYQNSVISPRLIGTRGAWFSGGIEYNFPISHSPTTMDHVNSTIHHYEDGSVSVIFGHVEHISYMNWKVELKLYPGKAYIEQNVKLYNPTPRENRYYFWTNTAVEYDHSMRLIYPFDWCTNSLDKGYVKWPYYKNMDCRNPTEIANSFETFGKLMYSDFFGVYNFAKKYGLVHVANRKMVKGAKFFIWGNDDKAKAWNRSLTDDGSQYLEIQSGLFESQSVYKMMKPHQELRWSEYWYPVSDMNGFKHAAKELAVNYEVLTDGIRFRFAATEQLLACRIVLLAQGKKYVQHIDLTPEKLVDVNFATDDSIVENDFELHVYCGNKHIVSLGQRDPFTAEYPDIDIYEDSRAKMAYETNDNWLKQAQIQESIGFAGEAMDLYLKNLELHPRCVISLNRLGNLYMQNMQFHEAESCFTKVLTYDNRNSQARFNLAVLEKEQGGIQKARRLFMDIAADGEYFQASIVELIKIDLLLGHYREAQTNIESSMTSSSYMKFLACLAYRKDGLPETAKLYLNQASAADEYLLAEHYFTTLSEHTKEAFLNFTRKDEKALLPVALEYTELGMYEEVTTILGWIDNPSLRHVLLQHHLKQSESGVQADIQECLAEASLDHVFINERMLVRILLDWKDRETSGKLDYLLGTYYYSVNREEEALDCYLSSYAKGQRYTVLLHGLGYIYERVLNDSDRAQLFYEEDLRINDGKNEDNLVQLEKIYRKKGLLEKRVQLVNLMEQVRIKSAPLLISLVHILMDCNEDDKAYHILTNEHFNDWESKYISGPFYRECIIRMVQKQLDKGDYAGAKQWMDRAEQYPESLNFGESSNAALSDIYFYRGIIHAKLGEEQEAIDQFKKGYNELHFDEIIKTEKSKTFSMKCMEELFKRESIH
jgi:tetratricopeptide (TPR) repeat protein